jgi:hypothetical protein
MPSAVVLDAIETGDIAEVDEVGELAQLLRHPQTDVRAAREQDRARAVRAQPCEPVERARRRVATVCRRELFLLRHADAIEARLERALVVRADSAFELVHAARSGQDRTVARASAQVAREGEADVVVTRRVLPRPSANSDITKPGVQKPHCEA